MDDQSEIFIVVDENDNILGYRSRFDCHHNKSLIHRAICVVIFNSNGEILLQKRSRNKDTYPGFYTLSVSGHVGKGESYNKAAKREMLEEIGISTKIKFAAKHIVKSNTETETEVIYTAKFDGPFKINKDEVDGVKFFSDREIMKILNNLTPFAVDGLKILDILG